MADDFDPYYTWLGIRPEEQPPDHYRLIGLRQFESNGDVIANATDRQMQFLRSMQVGKRSAQSQALLNEISAAGGCLLDPERKAKYDQELRGKEAAKAQAAKAAAAKAKPLPKAAPLEPIPKNDNSPAQLPVAQGTPSYAAPSITPAKAAATKPGLSPALLAGAIGGALVLISLVAGIGYMISGGGRGKNTAAVTTPKTPENKAPVSSTISPTAPTAPAVSPAKPEPVDPGKKEPIAEQKTEPPAKAEPPPKTEAPMAEPSATAVASPTEPPKSNWQPPDSNTNATFRSFLGTYMYFLDRSKAHPYVNLQVPSNNLWTPEIQERFRGKIPSDEISYVGTARIVVPEDGTYVMGNDRGVRILVDGVLTGGDFDQDKQDVRLSKGAHVVTVEIHSHGQQYLKDNARISLKDKQTGKELEFFNTWPDIQKFLRIPIAEQRVTEVSGWQPSAENELKIDPQYINAVDVKHPVKDLLLSRGITPAPAESPAASPVAKVAVPEAVALEKARQQLRDVFGEEGRGATTPEKKAELAKKMLQVETESKNDAALQYALLDNARKLFAGAGDAELALAAVDRLGERFELDLWTLKTETATTISDVNVTAPVRDQIAGRLLAATEEAVSAQKFAAADDFARLAAKVSAKGKDVDLRKAINQKRGDLSRLKQHVAKFEEARAKLKTTADDAEANLVVGKFTALGLVDFDAGIPYLAKSGQGLYAAAAAADVLAAKGDKGAALSAADAWYKLAESIKGEDKGASTVAQRRARDWYEAAAREVQGLEKVRIERRLKELQGLATTLRGGSAPRATVAAQGEPRPSKPAGRGKAVSGMVGRSYVDGKDANLFFTYHPGYKLTRDEIQTLQNNLGTNNIRVELIGTLSLSADAEVAFHHVGGSSNGGVHHLQVDGMEIHAVGDDRTKDDTLTLRLGKGDHQVGWALTGGDLGDAQLEINLAKSGQNPSARLDIYSPADMVAAARALGVRQEFEYGTAPQEASAPAKPASKGPEKVVRTTARRPGARVPGKFEAVVVIPGDISAGGKDLMDGWEFKLKENLVVTELGVYDQKQDGLREVHEVAIWDLENDKDPVVKATIPAGEEGGLAGMFRCTSVDRVELQAGRRYAIVAHYPSPADPFVSLLNPEGLTIDYSPNIEVLGRRFAFPHKAMAFPNGSSPGPTQGTVGPTFRFDAVAKKK